MGASSPGRSSPTEVAAISVQWGDSDKLGDLLASKPSQFGKISQQGDTDSWSDAWDALQQSVRAPIKRARFNHRFELSLNVLDLLFKESDVRLKGTSASRFACGGQAVLLRREHADELSPAGSEISEVLLLLAGDGSKRRLDPLPVEREHSCIDSIGLGQFTHRARKIAHLARIDDDHRKTGRRTDSDCQTLVPSRCLEYNTLNRTVLNGGNPAGQRVFTVGELKYTKAAIGATYRDVHTVLRDVDTNKFHGVRGYFC